MISKLNSSLETENFGTKKQKSKDSGIIHIVYKLDILLFEKHYNLILFGETFVEKNKNNCKIIINEKEYGIKRAINVKDFGEYGINKDDKILDVILKGGNIEYMSFMFLDCTSLIEVDLSSFNSQNIKNVYGMFSNCRNLAKVNFSSFNTKNVANMGSMFYSCRSLTRLDLSSFDTQNVTDMEWMFGFCEGLTKLDLSSFSTQNVKEMGRMFDFCESRIQVKRKKFEKIKNDLKLRKYKINIIEI